ncbi:hypothetical protein Q5P01_010139 [Channa striata]|uniref:Uncharacterized protein n=1 Tax=Channa striata TaxID=64152 RepID=A0AA88N3Z2_CHASR|nr:hypothetical protein Q5P01_010139 [Channa striata]
MDMQSNISALLSNHQLLSHKISIVELRKRETLNTQPWMGLSQIDKLHCGTDFLPNPFPPLKKKKCTLICKFLWKTTFDMMMRNKCA